MDGNFVAYYRVSTQQQGKSGLGLEAQQSTVQNYLNGGNWKLLAEFTEVETGKGSNALNKRPQLKAALEFAKKNKATLLVAKLDRLGRNMAFVSALMEAGVDFVACDCPSANTLTLHILAAMGQYEAEVISERTKAALQAAKARGKKLGNPNLKVDNASRIEAANEFAEKLRPTLEAYRASGMSQRAIVAQLNATGVKTPRGKEWSLLQLQKTLKRLSVE